MNITENILKLNAFRGLEEDWDSEMGLPFSDTFIDSTIEKLRTLPVQPKIFPTGRGSIQFEYDKDDDYLEFEIFENKIELLLMRGNEVEREEDYIEPTEIPLIVNKFFNKNE